MTQELYRRLQQQLDQYSLGFPETASGIEIEILESLFSESDVSLFVQMTPALETTESIAARLGRELEEVSHQLEDMSQRGLLFRLKRPTETKFGAIPFVHGIFEFQLQTLSKELVQKIQRYFDEAFDKSFQNHGDSFLRTIPIGHSIDTTQRIASYDDALTLLKSKKKIVVTDCICRVSKNMVEEGCDKPLEACFMFGSMGQYYLDRKMGREITLQEATTILERCHEAGLVTQPATTQNPAGMCNCCGDCCAPLAALAKHPTPAQLVFSNYIIKLDVDLCTGCETCIDRCQMNALTLTETEVVSVDLDRCIGCGLCVTTCPAEALVLHPKPKDKQRVPPETSRDQMMAMAMKRNVF